MFQAPSRVGALASALADGAQDASAEAQTRTETQMQTQTRTKGGEGARRLTHRETSRGLSATVPPRKILAFDWAVARRLVVVSREVLRAEVGCEARTGRPCGRDPN